MAATRTAKPAPKKAPSTKEAPVAKKKATATKPKTTGAKKKQAPEQGKVFKDVYLSEHTRIRGHHLRGATFDKCMGGGAFGRRAIVRNVTLEGVTVGRFCALQQIDFHDVTVIGAVTQEEVRLELCTFDRVALRGHVGRIRIHDGGSPHDEAEKALLAKAGAREVAWALDIREARFAQAIIRGVPVEKILRDPARHVVIDKEKLRSDFTWKSLPLPLVRRVEQWLSMRGAWELFIACDTSPFFERQLEHQRILRDAGFAH